MPAKHVHESDDSGSEPEEQPRQRSHQRIELDADNDGGGTSSSDSDVPEKQKEQDSSEGEEDHSGEEGSSGEESTDAEDNIENQMANVPFEVLEKLRTDGRGPTGQAAREAARQAKGLKFKREYRHHPQEVTSKRPVGRFREVIQVPKTRYRDPRFDEGAGLLDKDRFRKQYSFLYDEKLPQDRREYKAAIKRERDEDKKREMQLELSRLEGHIAEAERATKRAKIVKELKGKEKAAVKEGKKPYYLKNSDIRKAELLEKYKELKASGQLTKFLEKRRKRNASKDHRLLPSTRR